MNKTRMTNAITKNERKTNASKKLNSKTAK